MMPDTDWLCPWTARRLRTHDRVRSVDIVAAGHLRVERTDSSVVDVGAISETSVELPHLHELWERIPRLGFVVNVKRDYHYGGGVIAACERRRVALGGMGDLMSALSTPDPSSYVEREVRYVRLALAQHTRVEDVARLDDRLYQIVRYDLDDVGLLVLNEYELTAEKARLAIERYRRFDAATNSNPHGTTTSSAVRAIEQAGRRYIPWNNLYSELNKKW